MNDNLPIIGKLGMLFDLIQTAAIAALGFVMWVRKPGEQALTENDQIDKRLSQVEQRQEQAVTREEFYGLRESMVRLDARYEGMQDSLHALAASQRRIEDFLLKQEGKA